MTNQDEKEFVALVTNGGNTLGRAVALELAKRHVKTVILEKKATPTLGQIVKEIQKQGGEAVCLSECEESLMNPESSIKKVLMSYGRLDLLVNLLLPLPDTPPRVLYETVQEMHSYSLATAKVLAISGRGSIINHCMLASSYSGTSLGSSLPGMRGAVTGLTRSLARDLGPSGVRVNCVLSGMFNFPELQNGIPLTVQKVKIPVGRLGTPEELAKLIVFLAMDASYMTGQIMIMDGGLTCGITAS